MYLSHSACFVNSGLGIHTFSLKLGTKRTVNISSPPQMRPGHIKDNCITLTSDLLKNDMWPCLYQWSKRFPQSLWLSSFWNYFFSWRNFQQGPCLSFPGCRHVWMWGLHSLCCQSENKMKQETRRKKSNDHRLILLVLNCCHLRTSIYMSWYISLFLRDKPFWWEFPFTWIK